MLHRTVAVVCPSFFSFVPLFSPLSSLRLFFLSVNPGMGARRIAKISAADNRYVEKYSRCSELDTLTREISSDLLDRVTIWPDGRLEITLNYLDESPLMLEEKGEIYHGTKESGDLLPDSAS